ncbi:hypothetical protein GDO86_017496 [Hymenochirus boettgeri]|uniref:Uncharacterized protein n=1 Tax=Hymenochirus boettgeri TaxID=247094 RepID=A0A8T2IST5_9PIPI|nr:hypothetical protein GDO86_017496 [Hymenochirus boettgeri]
MASVDLREELNCAICLCTYKDPVTLPCGHNYCQECIGNVLDRQLGSGVYTCPECRAEFKERPALQKNRNLRNIAELYLSAEPEEKVTGISCTYCVHSTILAVKSCLHCETSLCDVHLSAHNNSVEHVLTEPTATFSTRKCNNHKKLLEYYCCEDGAYICVSCCLAGDHRGHKVELMNEAFEKKKQKLRNSLVNLIPEREETEKRVTSLREHKKEVKEKAAGEMERVTALFKEIREQLEVLEHGVLNEISRQEEKILLQLSNLIQQLEASKDELSRKISYIEELCNMTNQLTFLEEKESNISYSGAEKIQNHAVPDVYETLLSETLFTGVCGIANWVMGKIYGQEATNLLLDIYTAGNYVVISGDQKIASFSYTDQGRPLSTDRFWSAQALSKEGFSTGRHYWDMEVSDSIYWAVGVAYPSVEKNGTQSYIGYNKKSWRLSRSFDKYLVRHDSNDTKLHHSPSCTKIRISLDYEAGRLSFYELRDPIRHLHSLTATFTEPLHAIVSIWGNDWVRIIS